MERQGREAPYKRPLLAAGLTAVAVTAIAQTCVWWLTLVCVVLLMVYCLMCRATLCAAVAVLFLVVAVGYRHWYVLPTTSLDGQRDTLTAVVEQAPTYGAMYTVRVTDSTHLRPGTRVMLLCNGEESPRVGGTVTAAVRLYAVADNQTYYASRGAFVCAFADGYEDEAIIVTERGVSPSADVRLRVLRALTAAPRRCMGETESAIVSALCFGERRFLSEDTAAAFQGSGLSHLLVVSGLHLSMVALAVRRLFLRLGMRPTCVLTLLAVWLFAWLVGFSPSILRAAVMCTVWLVGCLVFCRSDGLSSLGLAALILLAANPYTLWNAGFQLSFAATFGVLLLAPRLASRYQRVTDIDAPRWYALWRRLRHGVLNAAAVSLSALLFTLPIAAHHYGGFPLTSIPANVLAVPVAGAILLLGWLGGLCGLVPLLSGLSKCILLVTDWLVRYLEWVAEVGSPDWAWLTVAHRWQWLLLLGVCALPAYGIYRGIPLRRVAAGVAALAVAALTVGTLLTVSPFSVTIVPSDNEGGFVLRQGNRCALLLTRGGELREVTYQTAPFTPDTIVVAAHTAADDAQLQQFPAAQVLVTAAMPAGTEVELWRACRLTVHADGWWRLQAGETVLWIGTDPDTAPPDSDGPCVYVGGTPTHPPQEPYTVVCSDWWLRRHRPCLTGRETFVLERPITLIPHRGEWRMSPWL